MNELLKILISLSVSGSLLIGLLLICRPLYQNRLSRQWQYYIWLAVIARLLLPFGPEHSPVDRLFRLGEASPIQVEYQEAGAPEGQTGQVPAARPAGESLNRPVTARGLLSLARRSLWLLWLAVALVLLASRVASYRSFLRYLKAGRRQVSDIALLERLALACQRAGVHRPVELDTHGLISSPLLVGLWRPRILLPEGPVSPEDFDAIALHELTHCRRWDPVYKWLVQLTLCIHWFNPLVWRMARQVDRDCEFACDEAAVRGMDLEGRRAYGDALMGAAARQGQCPPPPTIALSQGAEQLRQRLSALMRPRKQSLWTGALSLMLAAALTAGSAAAGAYTGPARPVETPALSLNQLIGQLLGRLSVPEKESRLPAASSPAGQQDWAAQAEKYYRAESLPLFKAVFPRLQPEQQQAWLDRIYRDNQIAFFAVALDSLEQGSPMTETIAEQAYRDGKADFFSLLAYYMNETERQNWMDRALEDRNISFQAVLFQLTEEEWDWDWANSWKED